MSRMPTSSCWSTAVLQPCVTWGSIPDDFTWTSLELISRSIQTLRQWMDGWEIKASIMVDEAESRSITLSSAPPHTLTLAQMRAHRSKEQQTHASDLYVVNNRMMVTSSGLGYWPFGGHSFQTSPWRSRAGANVCVVLMRSLNPLKEKSVQMNLYQSVVLSWSFCSQTLNPEFHCDVRGV